jgi:gas vesicle protein
MKGIWMAFGIGAAAGAAVALLYAPQSGTATRKRLRKGVKQAGECMEDAGEYLRGQAEKLSEDAETFVKRARRQMEEVMEATNGLVDGAMKTAKAVRTLM